MTRKTKPPVAIYSALADASRCRIVEILRDGAQPVHELADAFAISRPAISRHLRVLKTAGLVVEVKKGRENLYSLRPGKLKYALDWMAAIRDTDGRLEEGPVPEAAVVPAPETSATSESVPVVRPVRRPKAMPVSAPDVALASDEIAPAAARAAKAKAVTQMGFDF